MSAPTSAPSLSIADIDVLSRSVPHTGFLTVERYQLRHRLYAGGWTKPLDREVCVRGAASGVLPYDPERDAVVLVEQFRMGPFAVGAAPWMVEIVAGLIDPGETPEQVAVREAREECGCAVTDLLPITRYFPSPGSFAERVDVFCGRVDSRTAPAAGGAPHEGEDIRVLVVPWRTAKRQLEQGGYANAATIIALQWLALNRARVRRAWLGG
jgi:ADP-ribose pyrophosphatase